MIHIIIRTCPRDDGIAKLCYESFKYVGINGNYYFSAEQGNYSHIIKTGEKIVYREFVDNYGGGKGARGFILSLKDFNFDNNDIVILSDSDIIVYKNFLDELGNYDVVGCAASRKWNNNEIFHMSGQLQMYNGKTINKLRNMQLPEINKIINDMVNKTIDIADDTFNSYVTDLWSCKKKSINPGYWFHYKTYKYVGMDIVDVIRNMKKEILNIE